MERYLLISDAAKEVQVESHVLRYWEEELHLPIRRNELGHRYYTEGDVELFKQIKCMKEGGLQLKAIKMILKDGKINVMMEKGQGKAAAEMPEEEGIWQEAGIRTEEKIGKEKTAEGETEEKPEDNMAIRIIDGRDGGTQGDEVRAESREEKARRLQWLLQQLLRETLQENNRELCREIKESVVKELDYQFRVQEEKEEERTQRQSRREEEYYQKLDELLRKKTRTREAKKSGRQEREKKEKQEKQEKQAAGKRFGFF